MPSHERDYYEHYAATSRRIRVAAVYAAERCRAIMPLPTRRRRH